MRTLGIDIETFSSTDLTESGIYKYVESADFEIMLFGYVVDSDPIQLEDITERYTISNTLLKALRDPHVIKTAWNAIFERIAIERFFGIKTPIESWECTMSKAAQLGLPLGLEACSRALNLKHNKDAIGKSLIRYFCVPCKPTKTNEQRIRNYPENNPVKWQQFKDYCIQDVRVEQAIKKTLSWFPFSDREKQIYVLDQKINDRGISVNMQLVDNALTFNTAHTKEVSKNILNKTGIQNANSLPQLKKWIAQKTQTTIKSLSKEAVEKIMTDYEELGGFADIGDPDVIEVISLKGEISKSSIAKYDAIKKGVCADGRVRGLFQYYGATRTGRWAGRQIQVHNLKRNDFIAEGIDYLPIARDLVLEGNLDLFKLFFNVPETLSQLIRTAFIAPEDKLLCPADFSAIEARVLAWLANEKWRIDAFKRGEDIYIASASRMFKTEQIDKKSPLRQRGKVAELAFGYGGAIQAAIEMGALKMGIQSEELQELVDYWRENNPAIVKYWKAIHRTAIKAIKEGSSVYGRIRFKFVRGHLLCFLPSGRPLVYWNARLGVNKWGGESITYFGMDNGKFKRLNTYGGKFVENIVQATSRDILADKMILLDNEGFEIILHVHDEAVPELYKKLAEKDRIKINKIMSSPVEWAPGLLLAVESFLTPYYKKD